MVAVRLNIKGRELFTESNLKSCVLFVWLIGKKDFRRIWEIKQVFRNAVILTAMNA